MTIVVPEQELVNFFAHISSLSSSEDIRVATFSCDMEAELVFQYASFEFFPRGHVKIEPTQAPFFC